MDDIVKIRRHSCGNFIFHKIKIVTEINILEQNKEVAEIILPKGMGRMCVLGNEEVSFLN